jgi:signal transduction histidine kinase
MTVSDISTLDSSAGSASPRDLERLTRLSRAFTYATSLADILRLAVVQAAEMLGADKAILLLPDEDGVLHISASHGVSADVVDRFSESLDESLGSRLTGLAGTPMAEGFIGVPLVSKGNVIGLLAVFRPDLGAASADEEWLLSALADQVAAPLENARLAEQLERSALISENGRLFEAERAARKEAESAREEAEMARLEAEAARREAEAARDLAEQSDRSKAAFLAAMSHDLRTPLNAIAGYVQIMSMGLRGPLTPEQEGDLERIAKNQRHLLSVVSEVLDYARIGAAQASYNYSEVSLDSAVQDAESMVAPQMTAKRIEYRYISPGTPVTVRTDRAKLQQILLNLLSNAIKFTPENGAITVGFEVLREGKFAKSPVAQIRVSDTGPGIPPEKLESVFLPFVQLERTLNHPGEGIGLGLAISRELARALGGSLEVESVYGEGATFTLTIPIESDSVSDALA